jgi:hypothetical protein
MSVSTSVDKIVECKKVVNEPTRDKELRYVS